MILISKLKDSGSLCAFFVILVAADLLVNRSHYRSPGWIGCKSDGWIGVAEKIGSITRGRRRKKDERATPRRLGSYRGRKNDSKDGPPPR